MFAVYAERRVTISQLMAPGTSLKAHLSRYEIQEQDLIFSHTFCPCCFMHYKEQFGLAPGRAARVLKTGPGGQIDKDEQLSATV